MQTGADDTLVLILIGSAAMLIFAGMVILLHYRHIRRFLKQQAVTQQLQMDHQRELLTAVINSQEEERKRLGQDLHDDVGTALSNLRLAIQVFNKSKNDQYDDFENLTKKMIDKIIDDMRTISHNLCPAGLESYGLIGSLEEMFEQIQAHCVIKLQTSPEATAMIEQLNSEKTIAIYRITKELVNNSLRHGHATYVNLTLSVTGSILNYDYQDNGTGMAIKDHPNPGLGLRNIESRVKMIGATPDYSQVAGSGYSFKFKLMVENG